MKLDPAPPARPSRAIGTDPASSSHSAASRTSFGWNAGYTEPTGLGMDRLTLVGKARAAEIA